MIICSRKELYKDFSSDSHAGLLFVADWDYIKIMNHFLAHMLKLAVTYGVSCDKGNTSLPPDFIFSVYDSFFLIRKAAFGIRISY